MKNSIKKILQKILGLEKYLYYFSLFIIKTLKRNKKEGDFMHFLKILPQEGDLLDIGANIGVMTYFLSKSHPHSTIYAFEPVQFNYNNIEKLIQNFQLKNVELHKTALGDKSGFVDMGIPTINNARLHGLCHVQHESIESFSSEETQKAPVSPLDKIAEVKAAKKISGIKMDVENFEYYVLKGGVETIQKHRPIIYTELWDNENRQKCFDFIRQLNYKVMVYHNTMLCNFEAEQHTSQNFFFIPN